MSNPSQTDTHDKPEARHQIKLKAIPLPENQPRCSLDTLPGFQEFCLTGGEIVRTITDWHAGDDIYGHLVKNISDDEDMTPKSGEDISQEDCVPLMTFRISIEDFDPSVHPTPFHGQQPGNKIVFIEVRFDEGNSFFVIFHAQDDQVQEAEAHPVNSTSFLVGAISDDFPLSDDPPGIIMHQITVDTSVPGTGEVRGDLLGQFSPGGTALWFIDAIHRLLMKAAITNCSH